MPIRLPLGVVGSQQEESEAIGGVVRPTGAVAVVVEWASVGLVAWVILAVVGLLSAGRSS